MDQDCSKGIDCTVRKGSSALWRECDSVRSRKRVYDSLSGRDPNVFHDMTLKPMLTALALHVI